MAVIPFRRPRKETIRGAARAIVTDATGSISKPCAVIVVALNLSGDYAIRSASDGQMHDMDKLSRVIAVLEKKRQGLIEEN